MLFVVEINAGSDSRNIPCRTLAQAKKIARGAETLKTFAGVKIVKKP